MIENVLFFVRLLLLNFLLDAIVYKTMQTRSFISWKKTARITIILILSPKILSWKCPISQFSDFKDFF